MKRPLTSEVNIAVRETSGLARSGKARAEKEHIKNQTMMDGKLETQTIQWQHTLHLDSMQLTVDQQSDEINSLNARHQQDQLRIQNLSQQQELATTENKQLALQITTQQEMIEQLRKELDLLKSKQEQK